MRRRVAIRLAAWGGHDGLACAAVTPGGTGSCGLSMTPLFALAGRAQPT